VRTATKPPQPIEKSTAGASLLAQVIVTKWADHQPLHRQEKMFERHGIDISRKTMGGWMAQCAELLDPSYQLMKKELLSSKVIGTDDTSVKVLDRKLPFARIGRIWPYVGDTHHPVIVYDYTPTRPRDRARVRRSFLRDTKDTCRRTPTRSTMHFSSRSLP
jgi:transposase